MKKNYVSMRADTLPMFSNKFLNLLSYAHWTVPLIIYIPVIIVLSLVSFFKYETSILYFFSLYVGGLFFWTFIEYVLHRFIFHYHPTSNFGKRISWIMHGVHHDYPSDPLRLVMPPSVSIPSVIMFGSIFYVSLGERLAYGFTAGFLSGYLFYEMCHYAFHHLAIRNSLWKSLKDHHMRHHLKDHYNNFGVSSTLWDFVCGTCHLIKKK